MSTPSLHLWPHQQYALDEVPRLIAQGQRRILLTTPTGGGKSLVACELIRRYVTQGWRAAIYTNRRLLIEQLGRVLDQYGIGHGVRASGYHDDRELPVQISSLPTERQRVLKKDEWEIHGQGEAKVLAIVDEAHLNGAATAQAILARHHEAGAIIVGMTATPIGLGHLYDYMLQAGTPSELRRCGALVPAYHYGPDEPDMRKFKPNVKTGEYSEGNVKKAIMTKCVFARVWDSWRLLNPEMRPTLLFGPDVAGALWFAEQFMAKGIPWAHIDGQNIYLDGQLHTTSQSLRDEVIGRLKDGLIRGASCRYVLREGVDIPIASHGIFATVMGGLQTWLQAAGRLLRAAPGKTRATLQDHGGMWWRHGSVNVDRDWRLEHTESMLAGLRAERFRDKSDQGEPEPIRCPACGMIRTAGPVCPQCGHECKRRSRMVVQINGTLKEHFGDIYRPRRLTTKPDAAQIWERMYWRARKAGMTFRQAEALFAVENSWGWPPHDLPFMPTREYDWFLSVREVPVERLTSTQKEQPCESRT